MQRGGRGKVRREGGKGGGGRGGGEGGGGRGGGREEGGGRERDREKERERAREKGGPDEWLTSERLIGVKVKHSVRVSLSAARASCCGANQKHSR